MHAMSLKTTRRKPSHACGLALLLAPLLPGSAAETVTGVVIDVKSDLIQFGIAESNVVADGQADDTPLLQAAVDFVAGKGGGTVVVPPGLYRVANLAIEPGVEVVGAGPERTIFRAWSAAVMFRVGGGSLRGFTAYGTPTEDKSGENWLVGKQSRGSSATAAHVIGVYDAVGPVVIDHVHAYEARYDPLYVRSVDGFLVTNCRFDRAGRNNTSLVGNTENFVFSDCTFGSLWGLYHVDLEQNGSNYIRNGAFVNCVFDGTRAGEMNTDTWGRMLIFHGHEGLENYNVSVIGCTFKAVCIRMVGVHPTVRFLYNTWEDVPGSVFVRVRTNPVAEFRNAVVRGNRFLSDGKPTTNDLVYGVTFTGASVFEGNVPEVPYERGTRAASADPQWQEDHPAVLKTGVGDVVVKRDESAAGEVFLVRMPLMGHEFRFADRTVAKYGAGKGADLAFHIDPLLALGKAGLRRLGSGTLEDYVATPAEGFVRALWGAEPGDVVAVKTNEGKTAVVQILAMTKSDVSFRYAER